MKACVIKELFIALVHFEIVYLFLLTHFCLLFSVFVFKQVDVYRHNLWFN